MSQVADGEWHPSEGCSFKFSVLPASLIMEEGDAGEGLVQSPL